MLLNQWCLVCSVRKWQRYFHIQESIVSFISQCSLEVMRCLGTWKGNTTEQISNELLITCVKGIEAHISATIFDTEMEFFSTFPLLFWKLFVSSFLPNVLHCSFDIATSMCHLATKTLPPHISVFPELISFLLCDSCPNLWFPSLSWSFLSVFLFFSC